MTHNTNKNKSQTEINQKLFKFCSDSVQILENLFLVRTAELTLGNSTGLLFLMSFRLLFRRSKLILSGVSKLISAESSCKTK